MVAIVILITKRLALFYLMNIFFYIYSRKAFTQHFMKWTITTIIQSLILKRQPHGDAGHCCRCDRKMLLKDLKGEVSQRNAFGSKKKHLYPSFYLQENLLK